MTQAQWDMLQDLWEDGKSMAYIRQATGISQELLDKYHDLWYDVSNPITPRYKDLVPGA